MTASTHAYTAELLGSAASVLSPRGGRIGLNARRAPHVQGTVTFAIPSPTTLAALDPRVNVNPRVKISAEAFLPFGTQSRDFDLCVRSRPIPLANGTYGLALASDETLLQDYSPLSDIDLSEHAMSGRALVLAVLTTVLPDAVLAPGADFTISTEAATEVLLWRAGVDALAYLAPILQASGRRIVCDENRQWSIRDDSYFTGGALSIRYGVNLIDGDDTIDRDDWYDAAVARYTWDDLAGEQQISIDAYPPPGTPYNRVRFFEFDTPYPGPGFAEYAVHRAAGRGREVRFTTVSDWRARAEQPIVGYLPDTPAQSGLTDSVVFDLDTDRMTVTTRSVDARPGSIDLLSGTINALTGTINDL